MIVSNLKYVNKLINKAIDDLEAAPEKMIISDLLEKIEALDRYYKTWCDETDIDYGDEVGTTYNDELCGPNMEFYIELTNSKFCALLL